MARGERVIGLFLALFGALWIGESLRLPYASGFAPGSGFLPLWLGAILIGLACLLVYRSFASVTHAPTEEPISRRALGRIAPVVVGLALAVAAVEWIGFVVAVTVYLAFLVRVMERRPWSAAIVFSAATAAALFLIFKVWLRVPLPMGPWGF